MYNLNNNVTASNVFSNKCILDMPRFNLKIEFHHNNLNMEKLMSIKGDVMSTFLYFQKYFGPKKNKPEADFELKLNIFDDKNEYFTKNAGSVINIHLDEYPSTLQDGLINNFLHYATQGYVNKIPPVLKSGIISHMKNRGNSNLTQEGVDYIKSQGINPSEILNIHNKNIDVSKVGHALVAFLEEQNPYLIEHIFSAIRRGKNVVLDNLLKQVNENDQFSDWLSSKTFESHTSHTSNEVFQNEQFLDSSLFKTSKLHTNHINNEVSQDTFFSKVEIIKVPGSRFEVELHHNTLDEKKIKKFESDIINTFKNFQETFNFTEHNVGPYKIKCHVFDSYESYKKDGAEIFNLNTKTNIGFANPWSLNYTANIYFGQCPEDSRILKHEIAHGLTFHALGRDNIGEIPPSIMEGIARYIEHKGEGPNGKIFEQVKSLDLSPSKIYKLTREGEISVYKAGHVLITFLEEKAPDLIDNTLEGFRDGNYILTKNMFENELKAYEKDFSDWLSLKTPELNTSNTNNENNQPPDSLPPKTFEPNKSHHNDKVSQDTFFSKVEIIKIPGSKLEVELHHNTLDKQKIEKFRSDIVNTFKDFKESFNLRESTTGPYKFKLHVFDNIDSYHKNVSEVSGFKISSNNIGIAIPKFNNTNYIADIFISQDEDKLFVLKHELVHGLTYAAAGGKGVWFPKAIMEGIATFIDSKGKHNHINSNIEYTKSKNLSLSEIYKLTKSSNVDYYAAGSILVMFLEEKHPHLIDNALYDLRYKNSALVRDELEDKLKHYEKDFSNWLDHKVNSFKTNIDLSDLYNNIEERVVYTAEDANNYQFPVEQSQNDYQNGIAAEYYL